jgi:hypothetical protein
MDVFVTGPVWIDSVGPGPWPELIVCTNVGFYWDGTGKVSIQAAQGPGPAISTFDYWGWGTLRIGIWTDFLPWQDLWTWRQCWLPLAGWGAPDFIQPGLNVLSWSQRLDSVGAGIDKNVWIVGTGITPANRLDIGIPQFQFQIGIEPPGTG